MNVSQMYKPISFDSRFSPANRFRPPSRPPPPFRSDSLDWITKDMPPRQKALFNDCPKDFTEKDIENYKQKLKTELWGYFLELVTMGKINDNIINCVKGFNNRLNLFTEDKTIKEKYISLGTLAWPVDCIESEYNKAKNLFRHECNIKKSIEKLSSLLQDPMLGNETKSQLKNILSSIDVSPQVMSLPTSDNVPVKVCTKCNSVYRREISECEKCNTKLFSLR